MNPSELNEILTEMVKDVTDYIYRHSARGKPRTNELNEKSRTAIRAATDQIEQQQRERMKILRDALDKIWTKPMTTKLAQEIAGNALSEWREATDG